MKNTKLTKDITSLLVQILNYGFADERQSKILSEFFSQSDTTITNKRPEKISDLFTNNSK